VTKTIAPVRQLAQSHPLHPLMIVIGLLVAAGTAKLGHAMWGIEGMLAFYPTYLVMRAAGRAAGLLSSIRLPQSLAPEQAFARVSACRIG